MKKAISAATSAALLASLLATAVAPAASAAVTVAGVGNVPLGGTSTNAATFTFSEETVGCISGVLGASATFSVDIVQKSGALGDGKVLFTGTPVVTAPGIMGATATLVGSSATSGSDTLQVKITGADPINKQQITITGLKIKSKASATLGAITATLRNVTGTVAACFLGTPGHPTGTVAVAVGAGATSVLVIPTDYTNCKFDLAPPASSKVDFGGTNAETAVGWTASSTLDVSGRQTLTVTALATGKSVGDSVTASTDCAGSTIPFTMTSPGSVVDTAVQDVGIVGTGSGAPGNVNPGEQNQTNVTPTYVYENHVGYIAKNTVVTFTISAAGVLFSASPTAQVWDVTTGTYANTIDNNRGDKTGMTLKNYSGLASADSSTVCNLSFDRTSCSVTVDTASVARPAGLASPYFDTLLGQTHPAAIKLTNMSFDVASTVTAGTAVNIVVTGPTAVRVDNNTVAYVSRVIVGVAAQPTIFINYNDQPSGQMSLTEQGAGFFTDGSVTSPNNVFGLCVTSKETFTRAPWAVVTVGDLKLLSGVVGATSVQGTLFTVGGASCAKWTVYSASSVASTIEIRGSDSANAVLPSGALNGPRYSVPANAAPGATLVNILVGNNTNVSDNTAIVSKVSNAVRAFKSGVTVAALSQPTIPQGTADSLGGKIQITETLAGQFKPFEEICVLVMPRTTNGLRTQDTLLKTATTNDLPIITTNGATGLLVDSVAAWGCDNNHFSILGTPADLTNSFHFDISQQAFGTLGQITISNIHYITTADAPQGPVLVTVAGWEAGVQFQTVVSNAKIGVAPKLNIAANSALGLKPTSGYTNKTPKTQAKGKYVTWKFTGGNSLAGQRVNVLWAKRVNGAWGGPVYLKSAWADANGIVTFAMKSATARAVNIRVQWPGNPSFAVSTSKALGAYWK